MSSVLVRVGEKGKSTEVPKRKGSPPYHPVEGVVAEIPDKVKISWEMVDAALIEFTPAVKEYRDAWLGYITQPSTGKWSVVVGKWDGVLKSMSGFRNMLYAWRDEWLSTFHQAIPLDEVDVLIEMAKLFTPPVDPVPVTEEIAIAFVGVDKEQSYALSLLRRWVDAWTLYIKYPTEASWSDVAKSWHEFQAAVRELEKSAEKWGVKIYLATPPEDSRTREEERKARRVITRADRKTWRENREEDRDAWREERKEREVRK